MIRGVKAMFGYKENTKKKRILLFYASNYNEKKI